jgi:hypothetical protein
MLPAWAKGGGLTRVASSGPTEAALRDPPTGIVVTIASGGNPLGMRRAHTKYR